MKEQEEEEKIAAYIREKAEKQAEIEAEQRYLPCYLGESRKVNKNKFKNWDNFKKKPPIVRLNLMLWGPKELLRLAKEPLEKKIDSKLKSEQKELRNFRKPVSSNNYKRKGDSRSRLKLKNLSSKLPSGSRDSSRKQRKDWRRKESSFYWSTLTSWRSKFLPKNKEASRPRSWKKSRTRSSRRPGSPRRRRLPISRRRRSSSWRNSTFQKSTLWNCRTKISTDDCISYHSFIISFISHSQPFLLAFFFLTLPETSLGSLAFCFFYLLTFFFVGFSASPMKNCPTINRIKATTTQIKAFFL